VLSPSTISTHLRAVFSKLGVHSRVQLGNLVLRKDATAGPVSTGPAVGRVVQRAACSITEVTAPGCEAGRSCAEFTV
jgi:DNA-binding transcriptional ArsR family regulator